MSDCLFCKFVKKEIETVSIFENDKVIAFKDLYPQAKKHFLFIHKEHTENINEMSEMDPDQIKDVFNAIREFTINNKLSKEGFRVVNNCGADAGQTIFHTHFHVLGGEKLGHFGS